MYSYGMVRQALEAGDKSGGRDRLFAEAKDGRKWREIRERDVYRQMAEPIRELGRRYRSEPVASLPYSAYRLFETTGSRIEYEQLYFSRRKRLAVLAFLGLLDGDEGTLRALEDTIWAICDEYTWCLPAHLGGASLDPANDRHRFTIDLFAAETGFYLAEITHLLEEQLSPFVVQRARREVLERVLEPYAALGSFWEWETLENNWASVCGGSVGAAALYLIPDGRKLAPILYRALGTMERYLNGFGRDGVSTEGVGYWGYGFGFFTIFARLLEQRTAGLLDLMQHDHVRSIALFHQHGYLLERFTVPFSDCEPVLPFPLGLIHGLKRRFPDVHVPKWEHHATLADDPIGRWAPYIRDFLWSNPDWSGEDWPDGCFFLPDAQWLVWRHAFDGVRYAFAAKGGHNDEPHNHNDIGSFVFQIGDEMLLAELGAGEYTKGYFGPERYDYLCNGSHGHSVPIVEGCFQQAGRRFQARDVHHESGKRRERFRLDIAGAYEVGNLLTLVREFVIGTEPRVRLEVRDRFSFLKPPKSVTSRFMTWYRPGLSGEGEVRIPGKRYGVRMVYDPADWNLTVREWSFVTKQSEQVAVYAMDLEARHLDRELELRVCFEPFRLDTEDGRG